MGTEALLNIIRQNRELEELGRQEKGNPTTCPEHDWPLNINSKGEKSCPIDGRIWR